MKTNEDEGTRKRKDQVRHCTDTENLEVGSVLFFLEKVHAGLPIWEGEFTQQEDETYPSYVSVPANPPLPFESFPWLIELYPFRSVIDPGSLVVFTDIILTSKAKHLQVCHT